MMFDWWMIPLFGAVVWVGCWLIERRMDKFYPDSTTRAGRAEIAAALREGRR